ncbi:MAG: hypothetical protein F2734_04360 [Actinobacteria bacterium]|jgi:hydroxyacyl-ACP dehydratase HTD2-like protein with hotdog domain|uniref:Unannotated protein n=1 Tax=freshwater metagenome TaxID=449393 RepID=A0A6J6XE10_9ZZZZ|nr:MaoC family dehydratase N-terminal domain-containing protein [Actinomycetota bacterium]MSY24123.1 hypothetical protein [Actinomycetota bacterium]MTA46193.1 hypothetical protein [Actinomycetota bacterium]
MFNPDAVGKSRKSSTTFKVTQESISNFAHAIGESEIINSSVTYSIMISLGPSQALLEENGLDWTRVVHGDQKFQNNRPLHAGDEVTCTSTIETYRAVAGNEIVTVRTDLHCEEELAQVQWTTLVMRG